MGVGRTDEAPFEAQGLIRIIEIAQGQSILNGLFRPVIERGEKNIPGLSRVQPIGGGGSGHAVPTPYTLNISVILLSGNGARLAIDLTTPIGQTALEDDIPRLPTTWQIVFLWLRAVGLSLVIKGTSLEIAIVLGITVPGVHLDQPGLIRVVILRFQLVVPA